MPGVRRDCGERPHCASGAVFGDGQSGSSDKANVLAVALLQLSAHTAVADDVLAVALLQLSAHTAVADDVLAVALLQLSAHTAVEDVWR